MKYFVPINKEVIKKDDLAQLTENMTQGTFSVWFLCTVLLQFEQISRTVKTYFWTSSFQIWFLCHNSFISMNVGWPENVKTNLFNNFFVGVHEGGEMDVSMWPVAQNTEELIFLRRF